MDRRKMLEGWNRAAHRYTKTRPKETHSLLKPLTVEQAGLLSENQRQAMLAKAGSPLTYKSDVTGAEFSKLLVWERLPNEVNGNVPRYLCLCSCGRTCEAAANLLLSGRKTDCGCVARERRRIKAWRVKKDLQAHGRKRRSARKFYGLIAA
jgi:hypothetical protein